MNDDLKTYLCDGCRAYGEPKKGRPFPHHWNIITVAVLPGKPEVKSQRYSLFLCPECALNLSPQFSASELLSVFLKHEDTH